MKKSWLTFHRWGFFRDSPRVLAVLPWAVAAGPGDSWLGIGLSATVEHTLRYLPSLIVLSRIDVQGVLGRLGWPSRRGREEARQAGQALGADMVLDGQVAVREGQVRVALNLLEVRGNHRFPVAELEGSEGLLLLPALVARVVELLGQPVSPATSCLLAALPTPSQAAFAACGRALQWDANPATYEKARAEYQRALELDPAYAYARKNLADLFLEAGRLEEAVAHYEKALQDQPHLAMARNNLAVAYRRQGRLEEARQSLIRVIHQNTDRLARAYAHNNLGNVYRQQGQDQRAQAEYQAALRLFPGYAMARANLGVIARRQGAEEEARRHLEEAIARGNEILAVAFAYRQLADLHAQRGEWDQAVAACRQALAIRPNDARAYLALGQGLQALGQIAPALEAYRAASILDRRPQVCAEARLRMGLLYQHQHLPAEACREYRAALRLRPEDPTARQGLAELTPAP